jgi:hypothetical protein
LIIATQGNTRIPSLLRCFAELKARKLNSNPKSGSSVLLMKIVFSPLSLEIAINVITQLEIRFAPFLVGARSSVVVEAICYKVAGSRLDKVN